MRPSANDYAPAHAGYVALCPEEDVLSAIEQQSSATQKVLSSLDEAKSEYRYAEGKWSIKQVIGHMVDAERILGYRVLAVARGDEQPLPGFDEQEYVRNASFDDWKLGDLLEEYALVRRTSIVFFRNLSRDAWHRRGTANGFPISVLGMAYVILGHERHHLGILQDRYGVK